MAIIIIKKHRNGSIFGEYRPVVHEFSRPGARCSAPSILDPSPDRPPPPPGYEGYESLFLLSPNLEADAC